MKRIIAWLLVFSIMLSLSGCSISFNEEAFFDYVQEEVSEAVDDAVDKAKEEASNKVNEAVDGAKEEVSQKVDQAVNGLKEEITQKGESSQKTDNSSGKSDKAKNNGNTWLENLLGYDMTITYLSNGGIGGPTEQRFKGGGYPKITDEKPTRDGYHFVGWTRLEGSNEPQFFAGVKTWCALTQDTTLYACWEAYNPNNPFTVQANTIQTLNFGGVLELVGGSAGVKNITIDHNYHLLKENDGKVIRIRCDCGFELVDREISKDNFVVIKSEGKHMLFDSLEAAQKEEYNQEYDLYCMRKAGLSPDTYFFSDYLKEEKPWTKGNYEKLKDDELSKALEDYIQCKLYAYEEVLSDLNFVNSKEEDNLQAFDIAHEGIKKIDEIIQLIYQDENMYISLVNQNDTWVSCDVYNVRFSVDTFRVIMTAVGTIHSMLSFGESYIELNQEEREGTDNTYYIEMQKIESGIEFAKALSNITGLFYSLIGGQTVPGLVPDPEDFKDKIINYEYGAVSYDIWCSLHNDGMHSEDLEACKRAFQSDGTEKVQVVIERWPNGPTAAQTINYIKQVEEIYPDALPSWYFYLGWRVEYEYACFVQMIIEDQI